MGSQPDSLVARLRAAIPGVDLTESWDAARSRARTWVRPAIQMGIASGMGYWAASHLAGDSAGYAPITAIAALGLGRERRLGRSALMIAGLFLGVVAAEIVTPLIGAGWWQIGLIMAASAIVAGALIGKELAVTYATINAAVLLTTPGSEGWIPSRLIAGLVGVAAAVTMILLIAPPHPAGLIIRRVDRAATRAADALDAAARALRDGQDDVERGDQRPLIVTSRRLDDEIERSHDTVDQALELTRWSPRRRSDATEVARLAEVADELRPALRTASTVARLADRATLTDVRAPDDLVDSICAAAEEVGELTRCLLADEPLADDVDERLSEAVTAVLRVESQQAVIIALQEEVRGLFADLAEIAGGDDSPEGVARATRREARGTTDHGVAYGRA